MTILTFPTIIGPSDINFTLVGNTQSATSPFDGSRQTLRQPGARWQATLTWARLPQADARVLEAFLASLNGTSGRFAYARPDRPRRALGTTAGAITVNGAGQTGSAIATAGWSWPNGPCLLAGDIFGWDDPAGRPQMHMATADAGPDPAGLMGVSITPPIRRSPNNGAVITLTPSAVFMLRSDDGGAVQSLPGGFGAARIDMIEALV